MAWFAAALPYLSAGAAAVGAVSTIQAGKQDSKALRMQAIAENQQTQADEEATRRRSQMLLGEQAAAIAEAGLGYEGSAGLIARQSAADTELDALNTRYVGRMRAVGLIGEANRSRREAGQLAGQQLLSAAAGADYGNFTVPQRSAQSRRLAWMSKPGKPATFNPNRGRPTTTLGALDFG